MKLDAFALMRTLQPVLFSIQSLMLGSTLGSQLVLDPREADNRIEAGPNPQEHSCTNELDIRPSLTSRNGRRLGRIS